MIKSNAIVQMRNNQVINLHFATVFIEVGKNDQVKEAISSGKAQMFKNTSGWRDDMKFCTTTTLHMSPSLH